MRFSKNNQSQRWLKYTVTRNNQNINIQWEENIWKAIMPRIHVMLLHRSNERKRCTVRETVIKWIKAYS